jgi:hypothetical protein
MTFVLLKAKENPLARGDFSFPDHSSINDENTRSA